MSAPRTGTGWWWLPAVVWVAAAAPRAAELPPEVRAFALRLEQEHGLEGAWLKQWLGRARRLDEVLQLMDRPAEALPWYRYRKMFLTRERTRNGRLFRAAHGESLRRIRERYGVPASIVTAILGVETSYGRNTGRHRVLDALFTLAFHYPRRAEFFRGELEQFLLFTRAAGLPPDRPRGSYAGAMGLPQFMPSSYRDYAVALEHDGPADIWEEPGDAAASVAHYLARHGWHRDAPVALRLELEPVQGRALAAWIATRIGGGRVTLAELRERGLQLPPELATSAAATPVMLVDLELRDGTEYWLGLPNFYVITRYNHSALYAMAVWQLAEAIRAPRRSEFGR